MENPDFMPFSLPETTHNNPSAQKSSLLKTVSSSLYLISSFR